VAGAGCGMCSSVAIVAAYLAADDESRPASLKSKFKIPGMTCSAKAYQVEVEGTALREFVSGTIMSSDRTTSGAGRDSIALCPIHSCLYSRASTHQGIGPLRTLNGAK
jgi:hypothetical protein